MVGLLFLKPNSQLVAEEILKNGQYFHVRSRKAIDFFLPGYGPKDPNSPEKIYDIDLDYGFVFSMTAFVSCIKSIQSEASWKYSGETDLVLIVVVKYFWPRFYSHSNSVSQLYWETIHHCGYAV